MRYWFGAVLFVGAAFFLWSGLRHRARALAIASRETIEARRDAASADPRSLAALGEIGRPIVLFFLAWVGVKSGLAYVWLDAGRWLSPFDVAGFYALLVAYGVSFTLASKYRISDALAAAEAADERAVSDRGAATGVPTARSPGPVAGVHRLPIPATGRRSGRRVSATAGMR
jgi:hypothetical protein